MLRPRSIWLLASLLALSPACKQSADEAETGEAGPGPAGSRGPGGSMRLPSIEIPKAVPAEASGVLVVRTPDSLLRSVAAFDLIGEVDSDDVEALEEELDAFLEKNIGLELSAVDGLTGFMLGDTGVGVVLVGAKGEPKGNVVGEHEGVPMVAVDKGVVVARIGDDLVLGEAEVVERCIAAAKGKAPSLADEKGLMVDLLTDDSRNVSLAAVVDMARLPSEMRDSELRGVTHAVVRYGAEGIEVTAIGEEETLAALSSKITGGLTMMTSMAEAEKQRVVDRGDLVEGAAMIVADHSARRLAKTLQPELDGDRLTLRVPVRLQDPALVTALVGMAAAVAIPALTKYTRRSKTSEARVQIAKMFDAASAYFNEEHLSRGSVLAFPSAVPPSEEPPHKCPNDGRSSGAAGVTPPLSVDCSQGPGGRCVPVAGKPSQPWEYSMSLWTDNEVWNGLSFMQEQAHHFHYDFRWTNGTWGFGDCMFTAQAFGDLDGDGLFSTYERAGAADENGVNAAAGLYIDNEVE